MTTPALFKKCITIKDFANIDIKELEDLIHPCGFYRNKAMNIKKCAKQVLDNFSGNVPQDIDSLLTLAGVGRKSANVILLEVFGMKDILVQQKILDVKIILLKSFVFIVKDNLTFSMLFLE